MSNRFLDVFDDDVADKLFKVMNKYSDNREKAKIYKKRLAKLGFVELKDIDKRITTGGLGTNQLTLAHPEHKKVVYKFALDSYGLDDNFYDEMNMSVIPRHSHVFEKHYTNMVAVHKRYTPIETYDEIRPFIKSIYKVLEKLSKDYILVDLSPKYNFRNYGIDEDTKDWVFIDCSDLIPKNFHGIEIEMKCERLYKKSKNSDVDTCGGELVYTDAYHSLECTKCGHVSNPIALKPKIKGGSNKMKSSNFHIGLTSEELFHLNSMIEDDRKTSEGVKVVITEKPKHPSFEKDDNNEEAENPLNQEESDDEEEDSDEDDAVNPLEDEQDSDEESENAKVKLRVNTPSPEIKTDGDNEIKYPVEAYTLSSKLGYVTRQETFKDFQPVGDTIVIMPTKIMNKPIDNYSEIVFNLADGESITLPISEMSLALSENELETSFDTNNNKLTFSDDGQYELVSHKLVDLFNSYNYDIDLVKERLVGAVDIKDIKVDELTDSITVNSDLLEDVSREEFIKYYSIMFKKYNTSSTKMFEVLVKDVLSQRL